LTLRNALRTKAQCVGVATYRANVSKMCRRSDVIEAAPDREAVFTSPAEFKKHHDIGLD